jgi:hypothetical protein
MQCYFYKFCPSELVQIAKLRGLPVAHINMLESLQEIPHDATQLQNLEECMYVLLYVQLSRELAIRTRNNGKQLRNNAAESRMRTLK